ncbi:MAG TPA: c-type cytochrome [Gemmatimonadales bacterium]|nr:c-type cytochrome [Gemmatimonadales bacterium]
MARGARRAWRVGLAAAGAAASAAALLACRAHADAQGQALAAAYGCAECHTSAGGPSLAGQVMGAWLAPNITPDPVSGIGAWSPDEVYRYLRTGRAPGRAQAAGPMAPVVAALRDSSDAAVRALVVWLARQPAWRDPADRASATARGAPMRPDPRLRGGALGNGGEAGGAPPGAWLYSGSCASCHGADGSGSGDGFYPSLYHNSAVGRRMPYNLLAVLLFGVQRRGPDSTSGVVMMPSFDGTGGHPAAGLTDPELAALTEFVIRRFGDSAAAPLDSTAVATARAGRWVTDTSPAALGDSVVRRRLVARGRLLAVGGEPAGARGACFRCHGLDGQGEAAAGFPRLAGVDARYLAKQLRDYRAGTRSDATMGPIARALDERDDRAVALYYAGLPARLTPAAAATGVATRALARRGAVVYADGVPERGVPPCASCHGPGGRGTHPLFPAVVQPAAYVEAQLRRWRSGERRNDVGRIMAEIARALPEADARAVAAYVGGPLLTAAPGRLTVDGPANARLARRPGP